MYLIKNILLYIFSFAVGSVIGSYFLNLFQIALLVFVVSFIIIIKASFGGYKLITLLSLCLMIFGLGLLYGNNFAQNFELDNSTKNDLGKYLDIEGVIVNNPEIKNGRQVFTFSNNKLKIEATVPKDPLLSYGMKVKIFGKLAKPENFLISNNKEVRYEALLRARGISLKFDGKRVEILSSNNNENFLLGKLYEFKRKVSNIVNRISSPESGLLFSMVFGGKSNLANNIIENFRIAGLLHIVVLSGQNLTIVAYLAVLIFTYTYGFKAGHILALVAIFLYAIIGGLEAATLRAVFMSSILILLLLFGRSASAGRILFFSALCMIIINPYILFDDPSFQLSVLAFLGIIYVAPPIKIWLIKKEISTKLADYISAIFGAQLTVMPFIIYSSQSITPYGLISNFLVLFVVGIITIYGMISVIVGAVSTYLFDVMSFPIKFLLKYILSVSDYIARLPFSSITINFNIFYVIIIYFLMGIYIYRRLQKDDMLPINQFVLVNEKEQIKKGQIPYVEEGPYIRTDEYGSDIVWD